MECRLLSSTGPWTCQISIRNEFDNVGNRLGEVSEIPFGGPITDKSHVELALRKAQFAVLNPGVPAKKILNATSAEELTDMATDKSQSFSKNVVCVDLQGPELTDLSFIDLPGQWCTVSLLEPTWLEYLFRSYPKCRARISWACRRHGCLAYWGEQLNSDCIAYDWFVLCFYVSSQTLSRPVLDDIENQKAVSLAKKVDWDGRRTIG